IFHLSQIFASYPERLLLRAEWLYCDILYTFYYASEVLMPRLHRSGKLILGILLTVLTLLGAAFLLFSLYSTEMIPVLYLALASGGALLGAVLTFLLTRRPERKVRLILGIIWTALFLAASLGAGFVVQRAHTAVRAVTEPKAEV